VNPTTKRVVISFRGTEGDKQLFEEVLMFGSIPYSW